MKLNKKGFMLAEVVVVSVVLISTIVGTYAGFNKAYSGQKLMEIAGSMNWRQHDQDILNVVCENRILLVDGGWDYLQDFGWINYLPDWLKKEYNESAKNVKIVHFAGQRKPWVNSSQNSEKFWEICKRTPFFNDVIERLDLNFDLKNSTLAPLLTKEEFDKISKKLKQ